MKPFLIGLLALFLLCVWEFVIPQLSAVTVWGHKYTMDELEVMCNTRAPFYNFSDGSKDLDKACDKFYADRGGLDAYEESKRIENCRFNGC